MDDYLSSSIFDPASFLQNDKISQLPCNTIAPTDHHQLEPQDHDHQIIPLQSDDLDNLLLQIPHFMDDHDHQLIKPINHDRRRKSSTLSAVDDYQSNEKEPAGDSKKKQKTIMHREVERQRRLEMSSLHLSLRSLLPFDYIKGRRSMSDHLDQAVKYIRHLQQRIQVLSDKRDSLKLEVSSPSSKGHDNDHDHHDHDHHDVTVNPCKGGVEIIVCAGCGVDEGLPLSRVLQCLFNEGLDVVTCISNKLNTKSIHSIQAQVGDGRSTAIDPVKLQQKLVNIHQYVGF